MNPYEIYIAYISWGVAGKRRPVLFIEEDNGYAKTFRITSQYANKSDDIKAKYLEITDWQQAGLSKLSYIDTGEQVRNSTRSDFLTVFYWSTFENRQTKAA